MMTIGEATGIQVPCGDGICELLHKDGEADDLMIARYIDDHAPGNICSLNQNTSSHSSSFYYAFEYQNPILSF